jgi:hypothetical protein
VGGRARAWWLAGLVALGWGHAAHAGAMRFCDRPADSSPARQDRLLRFGAIIKSELEKSGQGVALIARSGIDLSRFGVRYSHAGVSLQASENTPWSVRQLYYACDEGKPRIYDQGMSAFVLADDSSAVGYVSVVLLPQPEAADLERVALSNQQALQLLGATYSANAYPFSQRYQNCNQWVIELLAAAWGRLGAGPDDAEAQRAQAQVWLKGQGYRPSELAVNSRPLMWAGAFIPWLHNDDHPPEDIEQMTYRVSMPASIEAFVRARVPGATRVEFCHTDRYVVVRRGWALIPEGCEPGSQDTVIALD